MKYEYNKGKWVEASPPTPPSPMPSLDKILAFEQGEMGQEEAVEFIQSGIDAGWVWKLQGFYGRTAANLIEMGLCHQRAA